MPQQPYPPQVPDHGPLDWALAPGPQPPPPASPRRARRTRWRWATAVAGAGALVIAAAVVSTVGTRTVLDGRAVERDVTRVLVEDYALPQPKHVTCPPAPTVTPGETVTCEVTSSTSKLIKRLVLVITGDDGSYLVGMPGRGAP